MEEFKDFAAYVQKCDRAAGKSAIFKVKALIPSGQGLILKIFISGRSPQTYWF
jgi:hypothetical protein